MSGSFAEMNRLKGVFESKAVPDMSGVHCHAISGLVEMWFRELTEPITTHLLYDEFMACVCKCLHCSSVSED